MFLLPQLFPPPLSFHSRVTPLQQLFSRQPVLGSEAVVARQTRTFAAAGGGGLLDGTSTAQACRAELQLFPSRGLLLFDHQLRPLVVAGLVRLKFQKQICVWRLGYSGLGVLAVFRCPQVYVKESIGRLVITVVRRTRFVDCLSIVLTVQRFELTLWVHFKVICHASLVFIYIIIINIVVVVVVIIVIVVTVAAVDNLLLNLGRRRLDLFLGCFYILLDFFLYVPQRSETTNFLHGLTVDFLVVRRPRYLHRTFTLSGDFLQFVSELLRVEFLGNVYIYITFFQRFFSTVLVHLVLRVGEQFREVRHMFVNRRSLARLIVPVHDRLELIPGLYDIYEQRVVGIRRKTPAERSA